MDDFDVCVARITDRELRDAVVERFGEHRADRTLISRVVRYFAEKENTHALNVGAIRAGIKRPSPGPGDEAAVKRIKAEDSDDSETWCMLADVSVLMPVRKRMNIKFKKEELVLSAVKADDTTPETTVQYDTVRHAICTPTPDKAPGKAVSWTFTLLVDRSGQPGDDPKRKPFEFPHAVVFSFDEGALAVHRGNPATAAPATLPADSKNVLCTVVRQALGKTVLEPEVPLGRSKKTHKPQIEAYLGAKQSFAYLLPAGVLVGYKKPLLFAPSEQISEIGLTSVTSRTFNIEIQVDKAGSDSGKDSKTLELSMIDHNAYEDVKDYISDHKKRRAASSSSSAAAATDNDDVVDLTMESGDEGKSHGKKAVAALEKGYNSEEESEDEDYHPDDEGSAEETDSGSESGSGSGSGSDDEDGSGSDGDEEDGDEDGSEGVGESGSDDDGSDDDGSEVDSGDEMVVAEAAHTGRKRHADEASNSAGVDEEIEFETDG